MNHESDEARSLFLSALEQVGVDEWEGYDAAVVLYKEWIEEEKEAE